MLEQKVIDAVSEGKFTIWAVSTIDEGIEALTGTAALTIHRKVKNRLRKWMKEAGKLKKKYNVSHEENNGDETE